MKFKEFFYEALATASPQQRYAALLARRKAGLPFASPEDKDFFLKYAQSQQNAAVAPPATQQFQPTQTPEERARLDFDTLRHKNKNHMPMSPEERARLMMYYSKQQAYDKKFDRQQGWGEATTLGDGK